ncbi:MAG: VWA domain-containing protein, partial [Promethearchaeota archaeon]
HNSVKIAKLAKEVVEAKKEMQHRLSAIENGDWFKRPAKNHKERKVIEKKIEDEEMRPIKPSYQTILTDYRNIINKLSLIFRNFNNSLEIDKFSKRGRLNKNYIKTVMSNYKFKKCFTKKVRSKILKLIILVDISGSMDGVKMKAAKVALVLLVEALKNLAQIKIILFCGTMDARNIIVKDFEDPFKESNIDRFGRHKRDGSNLDGVSLSHEAAKYNGDEIFIVISDGQPAGHGGYGINECVQEVQEVRKRFKVFAFSIDARGEYLDKIYGKNYVLAQSRNDTDLMDKMVQFSKSVIKEYYR